MILNLKVDGQTLTLPEDSLGMVEKTLNYVKCVFDFTSEEWNETIKTAYFRNEKTGETASKILQNNECMIPHEVLEDEGYVSFSVVGEKENYRITSSAVSFFNNPTVYDGEPSDPTPTEYEQIIVLSLETMKIAQQVRTDADNGKFNGATGATGPQGPPGKDAVTETELSVESNNAIANSTVAKVLGNGTLIGFEKVDSLEDFEELSSRYPKGIPENAFLILYVTQDLSYTDPNTQFTFPPGLYLLTQQGEIRLCPDTESVNAQFNAVNNLIKDWGVVFASKADKSELNLVKLNLDDVSDTADEALTIAKGRNRALTFLTYQELSSWIDGDFTRLDGKTVSDLQTGDNLYIVETGVPDYWWDGTQIRPLETQKVDLSEYAEKDYVDEEIAEQVAVPNSDIANYLEVADILGIWKNATAGRTSFDNMFQGRTDITKIPELDMSSATTARYMCNGCTNLKSFVNSTTGNVTSFHHAFRDCSSAETIEIDTSKNAQFNGTFWGCSSLKELVIDMSRAQGMDYMCRNCSSLVSIKTLDFTGGSASASGKNYSNMFTGCPSLVHVEIVPGTIKGNLSFVNSPNLDSDSVASIFAGLADMSNYDAHTLTLHKDVQITQAQADGAVAKNWNIVGGTVNG